MSGHIARPGSRKIVDLYGCRMGAWQCGESCKTISVIRAANVIYLRW